MCGALNKDEGKVFIDGKDIDKEMNDVKRSFLKNCLVK